MATSSSPLLHICTVETWLSARTCGELTPGGASGGAFIHLSTPEQVHLPANRLFHGRRDLVLLVLDPQGLGSPVRWEPGVPGDPESMLFPHLYGPLPKSAVTGVVDYTPDADGMFSPPRL
ncbi:MAG: DUF952 domain-containing protein [Rhodococcus sp. (in: high G+C Gram-positive bacteria)]